MGSFLGIFVAAMFSIIPIIVITMIIVAIVKKNKDGEKAESFEKVVRMIYVYVLLIAFLFMTVGSVIYAFNSAVNYYIPESKITQINNATDVVKPDIAIYPGYSTKEIEKLQKESNLKSEKNLSITDFATAIAMLLISVPMFLYHGKLARKLKEA